MVLSTIPAMANAYRIPSISRKSVSFTAINCLNYENCLQMPDTAAFAIIAETFQVFSTLVTTVFCRNVGRKTVQDTVNHMISIRFDTSAGCEVILGEYVFQNKLQCLHSLARSHNQSMPQAKGLGQKMSIGISDLSRPLVADVCHTSSIQKPLNALQTTTALYFHSNGGGRMPVGMHFAFPLDSGAISCSHVVTSSRHDMQTIRTEKFSISFADAAKLASDEEYVSRQIRLRPAGNEGIRKILSIDQQAQRSLRNSLETAPTSGDLKHLQICVSCELEASCTIVPEIAVSSLDQIMAVCSLSDSTHILGLVGEDKSSLSPYQASMLCFYQMIDLLDIHVKHSLLSLPEADTRTPSHLSCEALAQGVSMAAMLECRRDSHHPMIHMQSNQIPTSMMKAALNISSEFSIDVYENCISTDRLVRSTQPRRAERHHHALQGTTRCVVISGGTRGLGLFVAKQFAQKGCVLVLTSLTGKIEQNELSQLNKKAHSVIVRVCDWSIPESIDQLLQWITESLPPIYLVVHAAGTIVPRYIADMDEHCFNETASCKVHSLTCSMEFPVIKSMAISSISGIWSQSGGSHYTAASVFQLKAAEWNTEAGRNVKAVAFGPFADIGMAANYRYE